MRGAQRGCVAPLDAAMPRAAVGMIDETLADVQEDKRMRLPDKVALITGAGSGIGRAMAQVFSREGARVIVADYSDEGGRGTVDLVRQAGGEATFVHVDVSDSVSVQQMATKA